MSDIVRPETPNGISLLLTDSGLDAADFQTLRHLMMSGVGSNSLRALQSDLAYIEAWCTAATGAPLPWPPSESLALTFIAHHLWDPEEKLRTPSHGMPDHVRHELMETGKLRVDGPHAPSTVDRRLSSWKSLCNWQNIDHPFGSKAIRKALTLAKRATQKPRTRKSKRAVDLTLMYVLLEHLDRLCAERPFDRESMADYLRAHRDRALLSVMFASGGRRRSEVSDLMMSQIIDPTPLPSSDEVVPVLGLRLGRTKTTSDQDDAKVFMSGRSVDYFNKWISVSKIKDGPIFRSITRWAKISSTSVSPHSVNAILKSRLSEIGKDPAEFSAHGIRAGYISTALREGIPAPEVMEQTLHRSLPTLLSYYKDENQQNSRAARLL